MVASVDHRAKRVDERMKAVDDKVTEVFDGAHTISRSLTEKAFNCDPDTPRREGSKGGRATNGQRHGPNESSMIS